MHLGNLVNVSDDVYPNRNPSSYSKVMAAISDPPGYLHEAIGQLLRLSCPHVSF
jgi:hypothetical protein